MPNYITISSNVFGDRLPHQWTNRDENHTISTSTLQGLSRLSSYWSDWYFMSSRHITWCGQEIREVLALRSPERIKTTFAWRLKIACFRFCMLSDGNGHVVLLWKCKHATPTPCDKHRSHPAPEFCGPCNIRVFVHIALWFYLVHIHNCAVT
jgi:hypothetical protein